MSGSGLPPLFKTAPKTGVPTGNIGMPMPTTSALDQLLLQKGNYGDAGAISQGFTPQQLKMIPRIPTGGLLNNQSSSYFTPPRMTQTPKTGLFDNFGSNLMNNNLFMLGAALSDRSKPFAQNFANFQNNMLQRQLLGRQLQQQDLANTLKLLEFQRPDLTDRKFLQDKSGKIYTTTTDKKTGITTVRDGSGNIVSDTKDLELRPYDKGASTISEFNQAKQLGLIPPETTYEKFLSLKTTTQIKQEFDPTKSIELGIKQTDAFTKSTAYKDFNKKLIKFRELEEYATNPTAFTDMAMIFALHKMLDPSSVVRGEEFALAESARPLADMVKVALEKIRTGERLTDSQRQQILAVARKSIQSEEIAYQNQFKNTIRNLERLNFPDIEGFKQTNLSLQLNPAEVELQRSTTRRDIGNAIGEKGFFTEQGASIARLYRIQNELKEEDE